MTASLDPQTIIDETTAISFKLFPHQPVVLDHGKGCYVFDTEGRQYLDFAAGIAVASLGHAHPKLVDTIAEQAGKLMACQVTYLTEARHAASKALIDNGNFDESFFCNSGTEAVEIAIKMGRKWAYDTKGPDARQIIAFRKSFHGRTYGAASVTEKRHDQPFFDPYLADIDFANLNDIASVEALVSDKTAAIIVEPVQGEGGLTPATPEFLAGLRAVCDRHNVALIFDEIQCGSGRLGRVYAHQVLGGTEPDIVCMAKGLGGGFPVGAVVAKARVSSAFGPGSHGTTYGGNPLACAVVACVMGEISRPDFLAHVRDVASYFDDQLNALKVRTGQIGRIAGAGLMRGIEPLPAAAGVMSKALRANGLMTTVAGGGLVRLTPPLIVTKPQVDQAIELLDATLQQDFSAA